MKFKVVTAFFAVALVAGFTILTLAASPAPVSAAKGPKADVTFTKWITGCVPSCAPGVLTNMVGIVGGDVGTGAFTGEVLSSVDNGTTTAIHALYHFNGGKHSFTADLFILQTDATGAGVVTIGVVTTGWLSGSRVTGGFDMVAPCDIDTPGSVLGSLCFTGTLHIGPKY
jgi:hypothetical protein